MLIGERNIAVIESGSLITEAEALAELTAQHERLSVTTQSYHWWVARLALSVGTIERATGIAPHRLRYGRLRPAELGIICPIIDDARHVMYEGFYREAEWYFRTAGYGIVDVRPEEAAILFETAAMASTLAIIPLEAAPESAALVQMLAAAGRSTHSQMRCAKCGYVWESRVPQPRKCPSSRCQTTFTYPDSPPPAAPRVTVTPERIEVPQ